MKPDKNICLNRKEQYESNKNLKFPTRLTSFILKEDKCSISAISPGIAEGVLITIDQVDLNIPNKILYIDSLTPDLVPLFPKLSGIVSRHGGLLSHLAIMARETNLPVVVTNDSITLDPGRKITINGTTGEII